VSDNVDLRTLKVKYPANPTAPETLRQTLRRNPTAKPDGAILWRNPTAPSGETRRGRI